MHATSTAAASSFVCGGGTYARGFCNSHSIHYSTIVGSRWYPTSRRYGSRRSSVPRFGLPEHASFDRSHGCLGNSLATIAYLNGGCSWYTGISVMWVYVSLLSHPAEHGYSGRPSRMTSDVSCHLKSVASLATASPRPRALLSSLLQALCVSALDWRFLPRCFLPLRWTTRSLKAGSDSCLLVWRITHRGIMLDQGLTQ
jgi:hypothetical protein